MPVPTTEPRSSPNESDTTQTRPQGKKTKRKSIIRARMLGRNPDKDRKDRGTKSDEPAAPNVEAEEKPKLAPEPVSTPSKRKNKTDETQKDGKGPVKERSGRRARFWSTLIACFGIKAVANHDEKHPAGRVDNSSLSSSQETAAPGKQSKKDNDIVDEKGVIRAEGGDRSKEKVEDSANSRLTTPTGTADSGRGMTSKTTQKSQNNESDSNAKPSTNSPPSLSIPSLPLVVTTPVHTPNTPTVPVDAGETDTVIVPPTPSRASHTLPIEETQGLTAGAVVPPGATADDYHQNAAVGVDDGNSEGTSFTDDEFHDAPEEDMEAEEARLIANGGSGIPIGPDGKPKPLLPPLADRHKGRKCLVLDMDETLLHSSFKLMPTHDFTVAVEIEWQWHNAYVLKRPGVEEFLRRMGEIYEVVVYTASVSKYADPVLDKVDIHKAVTHRLFRESCYSHRGNYVKDLSMLGRPLEDCIILDNSPASYLFNPSNAVPVMTWFNDPHDTELTDLIGFLTDLATAGDVRGILARNL